jgi:hypothetical protein
MNNEEHKDKEIETEDQTEEKELSFLETMHNLFLAPFSNYYF